MQHKLIKMAVASILLSTNIAFASHDAMLIEYCRTKGGMDEKMTAEFMTMAGKQNGFTQVFCNFRAGSGHVSVGLRTFASPTPNIAATYMQVLPEIKPDSQLWKGEYMNPSANVCKNLGGSSIGFVATGGFANNLGQSDICVFGDGSMVSAWSLIYMANNREGYDEIKHNVASIPLAIHIPK